MSDWVSERFVDCRNIVFTGQKHFLLSNQQCQST